MEINYDILSVTFFSSKNSIKIFINFVISIKKISEKNFLLRNDKMNFEFNARNLTEDEAKKDFADDIVDILTYGVEQGRIFNWLKNWGFELKENPNESYKNAVEQAKEKINFEKAKNNYFVNGLDIPFKDDSSFEQIDENNWSYKSR